MLKGGYSLKTTLDHRHLRLEQIGGIAGGMIDDTKR